MATGLIPVSRRWWKSESSIAPRFAITPRLFGRQETHLCRGTRDRQIELMHRLGVIPEPTDEAWEATRQRLNV